MPQARLRVLPGNRIAGGSNTVHASTVTKRQWQGSNNKSVHNCCRTVCTTHKVNTWLWKLCGGSVEQLNMLLIAYTKWYTKWMSRISIVCTFYSPTLHKSPHSEAEAHVCMCSVTQNKSCSAASIANSNSNHLLSKLRRRALCIQNTTLQTTTREASKEQNVKLKRQTIWKIWDCWHTKIRGVIASWWLDGKYGVRWAWRAETANLASSKWRK